MPTSKPPKVGIGWSKFLRLCLWLLTRLGSAWGYGGDLNLRPSHFHTCPLTSAPQRYKMSPCRTVFELSFLSHCSDPGCVNSVASWRNASSCSWSGCRCPGSSSCRGTWSCWQCRCPRFTTTLRYVGLRFWSSWPRIFLLTSYQSPICRFMVRSYQGSRTCFPSSPWPLSAIEIACADRSSELHPSGAVHLLGLAIEQWTICYYAEYVGVCSLAAHSRCCVTFFFVDTGLMYWSVLHNFAFFAMSKRTIYVQ